MSEKNSEKLTELYISDDYLKIERSSSQGNQKKYYKDGRYYKLNALGYENTAEILVSMVLKHSNVESYVSYYLCKVNGVSACWSEDFLKENESFFTFDYIYKAAHFHSLSDDIMKYDSVEDRYYPAPIFDNGAALLSNFVLFPPMDDIDDLIDNVTGKPFSGSLERQFLAIKNKLKINYPALLDELETFKDCRAKYVLLKQLKRYEKIFNECEQ